MSAELATDNNDGVPQTPSIKIDPKTRQPQESMIRDAAHAYECAEGFQQARRPANGQNTKTVEVYNGKPPFIQSALNSSGQGWRNNWTTKPLATVIDRGLVPYVGMINAMQYLTASKLPAQMDPNQDKSNKFREIVTRTIRKWQGFGDLIEGIPVELGLIGYTMTGRVDPMTWRPTIYRSDDGYVPEDSPREASKIPLAALRHSFRPDELYPLIKDKEAATEAGWNVDNLIKAINESEPKPRPNAGEERKMEDEERDAVVTPAFRVGSPIIDTWIVPYNEIDGQVSVYIVRKTDGMELYFGSETFDRMEDSITLHTSERGNGKYYGSRGVAKSLVNIAIALDRVRCEYADAVKRSSMIVLHTKSGSREEAQLNVRTPMAVIDFDGEVVPDGFPDPSVLFESLARMLMGLMETIGGVYLPQQATDPGNKDSTATAAALTAQRENELRQGNLARQQNQFYDMMTGMQRAFCHKENILAAKMLYEARGLGGGVVPKEIAEFAEEVGMPVSAELIIPERPKWTDEDAVEAIVEMLQEGLTPVEIYMLGRSSAADVAGDSPQQMAAKLGNVVSVYGADPTANSRPIKKQHTAAISNPEIADTMWPDNPAIELDAQAAARQQNQETGNILANIPDSPIPVLPDDKHLIHFDTGMGSIDGIAEKFKQVNVIPPEDFIVGLNNLCLHLEGHLQGAMQQGQDPKSPEMMQRVLRLDTAKQAVQALAITAQEEKAALEAGRQQAAAAGAQAALEMPTPSVGTVSAPPAAPINPAAAAPPPPEPQPIAPGTPTLPGLPPPPPMTPV